MPELQFMPVGKAFNRVGAVKADGTPYQQVRGVSVAATGRHFRFWEHDIVRRTEEQMELYRPPVAGPDWRFESAGRSFYHALLSAMNTSEPIFVTINRPAREVEDGPVIAKDAAPLLAQDGNPAPGRVTFVNPETGELKVVMDLRGLPVATSGEGAYVDQFTVAEAQVTRTERSTTTYSRSQEVRRRVLTRAAGLCERCGIKGFRTAVGVYSETHHVVPLSESGRDSTDNVVALCPICHRAAHYALERDAIKQDLVRRLQNYREKSAPGLPE